MYGPLRRRTQPCGVHTMCSTVANVFVGLRPVADRICCDTYASNVAIDVLLCNALVTSLDNSVLPF